MILIVSLPRSNLLSRRWERSWDSFNPPWLTSRKTNNPSPRTANRSKRTTLPLTLRIRNMRFMLMTDTLYRVTTTLSLALRSCASDAPFWDLPPPHTFLYAPFRGHDDSPSYLCSTTLKGQWGVSPYVKIQVPLRDQEGCLELSHEIPRRC